MRITAPVPVTIKHADGLADGVIEWLTLARLALVARFEAQRGDTLDLRIDLVGRGRTVYSGARVESVSPSTRPRLTCVVVVLEGMSTEDAAEYAAWLSWRSTSVGRGGLGPSTAPPARPAPTMGHSTTSRGPSTEAPPLRVAPPSWATPTPPIAGPAPAPAPPSARPPPPPRPATTIPAGQPVYTDPPLDEQEGEGLMPEDPAFVVGRGFAGVRVRWWTATALRRSWRSELRFRGLRVPYVGEAPTFGKRVFIVLQVPDGEIFQGLATVVSVLEDSVAVQFDIPANELAAIQKAAEAAGKVD
jgi:hypothetical protein